MGSDQAGLHQPLQSSSFATFSTDNKILSRFSSRARAILRMNRPETQKTEAMSPVSATWMPQNAHSVTQPPSTNEASSYCMSHQYPSMPAWDSSLVSLHQTADIPSSQPTSIQQGLLPLDMMNNNSWPQKPCEDSFGIQGLDPDATIGQAYSTDEAVPILDLRYSNPPQDADYLSFGGGVKRRRMSGSSLTMSTSGPLSDIPAYDDFSAALSEAPSFNSDYPPTSNRTSLMSSTQLSPVPSPRLTPQSRPEQMRTQSRGRASPSPRPSMRSVPYSVDSSRGTKRWSTGSYGGVQNKRQSIYGAPSIHDMSGSSQRMSLQVPSTMSALPSAVPLNSGNYSTAPHQGSMMAGPPMLQWGSMLLPSQMPSLLGSQTLNSGMDRFDQPPPLPSQGFFRMLQSNGSPHSFHGHYTDLSDPPDLFAALHEEQIPPPPEDMNPSDPELMPYEQELRFDGDLYTPRWVRGHGNKREGWCGICKPGRWLVLKNSAFWYDKSFSHGVSAATGSSFQEPLDSRRMDGSPDVWEGLCGSCNDWIALVSSKKKGTTWFRHAYKCHTHPKVKDGPKRRRESNHTRVMAAQASSVSKAKTEGQGPETPQTASSSTPSLHTPNSARVPHFSSPNRPQKALTPAPLRLVSSNKAFGNQF